MQFLIRSLIYPLFKVNDGYVMALTEYTPADVYNDLITNGAHIYVTFSTKDKVLETINAP